MQINAGLLDKLVKAHRTAQSINRGLWQDAQDQERQIAHCRGQLESARRRQAESAHGGRPPDGVEEQDWRQQRALAQQDRYRDEARLLRQASPEAFTRYIGEMSGAGAADFEAAVQEAAAVVARAERTAAEIAEAQQVAGTRAGLLQGTLVAARTWLMENGLGQFAEGL